MYILAEITYLSQNRIFTEERTFQLNGVDFQKVQFADIAVSGKFISRNCSFREMDYKKWILRIFKFTENQQKYVFSVMPKLNA